MRKSKVSVSIDSSLLASVDRAADGKSRSEIVELALRRWLNERRRLELDEEIAAYYRDRHQDELAEDRDWSELSPRMIGKTWE